MLDNVHAQDVGIAPGEGLQCVYSAVRAFVFAVGVAMGNKAPFKYRFDDIAQGVMHHPVGKRRGADLSTFGFLDDKVGIGAGLVGLVTEFVLQF